MKSKKPEKLVEAQVLLWLRQNGFSADIIESKAVFSQKANRYLHSQTTAGMSDIVACDRDGHACYIELKAKGKRNNISLSQYVFLQGKIENGAFAVVVDSVDVLQKFYAQFKKLISEKKFSEAKNFLRDVLPKNSISTILDKDLDFDDS